MTPRRIWHEGDPEPDDYPYLIDNLGQLWVYDDDDGGDYSLWPGWWNPSEDTTPCPWEDLFTVHGCDELRECTEDEARTIDEELFS